MKKTNKLISILIAVAMLLSMAPISAFAASVVASGEFGASGSNLTWSLDSDGVLTISGSGAMEDFASVSKVPWYSKRTNVKTVVIESGVTNIGKDAFYGITSLVNATISDTVTSIGNRAFSGSGLTNFEFSDAGNLKTIENAAFSNTQIKSMVIPDGVTTLGSYVFGYGPIQSVTIPASVTSIGNYFFEETSSLNEVIFLGNKEPETIGDMVFLSCSSLAYVSVPADYEGDTFSNMKVAKATASVAEVNGQGFATLADAISAAQSINGAVLKLLSHISIDSGITIESGNFTIDLNGKELFSNGYFLLRIDGADVTIVDSAGGGVFNATNDQGNIVLEVLSGSANILGGTFDSAGYPATVRDGTLKLTGKDFVLNGNWRIGWYGGSIDLSACTADEVRIQACVEGLQASAVALPDGWGLFETDGTPCTDFVKNDIYVAKAGFKVTASVNPAEGGTVEGAGTYSSGATVTLTATAANGYRFINWIENGEEVSTSAVYTFTASKNRELTANFEIVPHTHEWVYTVSASGDRIIATCVSGDCPLENGIGGTLTISAPADLYVDGETAKEAVIDNQLVEAVDYTVTYSTADGSAPKTAGTYTASVTLGGATASVEFTLLNYAAMVTDKDGNAVGTYKTFEDAITAAEGSEGSTITLLDDITLTKEQNIRSGKFTLDLNGKNLINENSRVLYILEEADLTIKDSGEGGTIETKDESVDCIYNYGKLTVESGIIKGDGGIRNFGVLYFNDGTVEADNYPAIANYNDSTVYVYDGVLKGGKNSGAVENGGTLYVYGGEIESIVNVNNAYISGGKIDRDDNVALNLLGGTVEITGGSFTGTDRASGYYSGTPYGEWTVYYGEDATLTLKGGEFPNGFVVANTTANTFLAEGYAFYDKDGNKITVADDATKIDGYVQVKEYFAASVTDKDGNELEGSPYKTLAEAITAAQGSEGSTLTLLDDVTLTEEQYIYSGKFTLELNGKKIISENYNTLYILGNADLTINDSSEGGTIESKEQGYYAVYNYGTLTVESGVIKGDGGIDNIGTLIFKNGKIEAGTYSAIRNSDTAYVYNGILESSNETALYNDTDSTLYVYDGELSGNSAISNRGSAYIEGGEFTGNAVAALNLHGGTVEVTGGSFTGTDFSNGYYSGTPYGEWTVCYNEDATLILKGGEFPNGFVVDETTANTFLAEDYYYKDADGKLIDVADDATKIDGYVQVKEHFVASVTDKDGNAVGTYKTFADAITAASASEGSTVTLLDDVTLTEEQDISSGKFTLDLNGKTLLNETAAAICIESDADVTIKDSGEGGTIQTNGETAQAIFSYGTLTVEDGFFKGAAGVRNSGTLNFKNGKIEAGTYSAIAGSGTVYIYAGTFESSKSGAITVNTGGTAYIYGGEFSGYAGITNHGTAYIQGGKFTGSSYAALNLLGGTVEITGGSFTGKDTETGYYSGTPNGEWTVYCYNDPILIIKGGEFPNGFVVDETTANTFLAEGYYYKDADGKLITVSDDAKVINGYVKVSKGADLSDAVITVDKTEFVYNGQHQAPAVTVTIGGKTLTENVDYVVNARRWENGVPVQWFYYVDAGVYTSVINGLGDYTGKVEKEFVIKPATVDIIWEGDVFYFTGNPHKVTAKYIDVNGNESNEFELINYVNTDVGVYTATAIFADNNYSATEAALNHTYEIKWYDGAPDATVSGTKGENGWYTSAVTVTAPEGYTISTAVDGTYGNTITFVENEENAVYYLKQTENGYIAKVELGEIKFDFENPIAEITVGENKWNSFLNTVTFGYFFKETQSITITASDETSGVAKIEYFIATEEITDFENIEWIEYTEKFNIEPNSKNIIYAKATDNAGRYVIVNSDGIVLYTDSQVTTADTLTYTLTTIEDVEYSVDFKGNTVDYVKINNVELNTDEYEVTENSIIIKGEYVENLAADVVYEIVIGINPMGENFAVGDAPAEMKAYLAVEKITGSVIIINDISKVYDGTPVEAPQYETIGTGEVTIKYTSAIGEPQYTDVVPTQAGTYFVLVEIAETNKSTYDFGVAEFTIAKADSAITAAPTPNTPTYNGEAHNLISAGEAMYGTMVYSLDGTKYSETIPQGTDAGDYTVYYKVAGDANHNDTVAETVTVTIGKKPVSVSATVPDRIYGDDYRVDTSKVVITFDGIVDGDDVGYAVIDAYYHVHTVTDNAPVQVVYNVNGADAGNYQFPEFGDWIAPNYGVQATGRVLPRDIANAEITLGDALVYNGAEQTQTVAAVTVDGLEVTYTVSGNKATNVGVYELTITGNDNFAGEATALYEIAPDTTGIDVLTVDNVKSSDKEAIEAVAQQIENAVTDLADDEKKAEYKAITDKCDELLSKINDTANEIERIENAVNVYDEETVTSADIPELSKLIEDIKALTDSDNLTEDERAALEANDKAIDELVEKLEEVAEEINRVDEAVKSYDENTVKSSDSEDLAQLKEDVQSLIDSGNTTENEKTALEEMIKDIEGLEERIEEIESQLEEIANAENSYNPETVTSDDKAAIEEALAEIEAVNPDNLTDEQKAEYEEIKSGFDALLEKIEAAEKSVADIGIELEMFDEKRVTIFWEDDIEALKAKIDELLADENMGEAEKTKLEEYKAECDNLIEIIHTPAEYFSLRFFYLIWDCLTWKYNGILWLFSKIFGFEFNTAIA